MKNAIPDAQIRAEVLRELMLDGRVKAKTLHVAVEQGVARLQGVVDSAAARAAAQGAALRAVGIRDVANTIAVRASGACLGDTTQIANAVREEALPRRALPHERIKCSATDGIATLQGHLESWAQYDHVQRCGQSLSAAREIRNLSGLDPPTVTTTALREAIDEALERHVARAAMQVETASIASSERGESEGGTEPKACAECEDEGGA